ncbi:MAG: hypothetical protein FWC79_06230 [Oscillospiraceae bacterium]|nr:hypothetical protein [Oscillospiraceae bacterium]
MLSYQAREYYKFVLKELREFESNIKVIFRIEEILGNYIEGLIGKAIESRGHGSARVKNLTYLGAIHPLASEIRSIFSDPNEFSLMKALKNFEKLKVRVNDYNEEIDDQDLIVNDLFSQMDDFLEVLDRHQQTGYPIEMLYEIVLRGESISNTYKSIIRFYSKFSDDLSDDKIADINEETVEILSIQLLGTEYGITEFGKKLILIDEIYENIASVIYREGEEYEKSKLIKVESGSLFNKMLGDKKIINTLKLVLDNTIKAIVIKDFLKVKTEMPKHELIKSNLEIIKAAEESGMDVSGAKGDMEKIIGKITSDMLKLVGDSGKIKVDEKTYQIEGDKQSLLEGKRQLMLETGETRDEIEYGDELESDSDLEEEGMER